MATAAPFNKKYFSKQEAKINSTDQKIANYLQKLTVLKTNECLWKRTCAEVKHRMQCYEKERELSRTWVHIDMDMFFAACEIRDRPDMEELPVAVGDYSMIQTTNYVARKYGVRSAMPGFLGKKMCPALVFIRSNKDKYMRISETEFLTTLREYDPSLESCGMDEANLDITDYLQEHGMDSMEGRVFMAEKLRAEILQKMRMTCSAGVGCNKMLAKIASELDKPDGQTVLSFEEGKIVEFMSGRKVRDIPGVGGV